MASLSAMIQLELPHINILSKMDLVANKKDVEEYVYFISPLFKDSTILLCINLLMFSRYLNPEAQVLLSQLNRQMAPKFGKLNKSLAELVRMT